MTIITTIFSNHMASNIKVVLPGDRITVGPEAILGPGIYLDKGSSPPITCKAGMLRGNPDDRVWVDFDAKRVHINFHIFLSLYYCFCYSMSLSKMIESLVWSLRQRGSCIVLILEVLCQQFCLSWHLKG